MKKAIILLSAVGALAVFGAASAYMASNANANTTATAAELRTQTFAVENMTCAMCPITVKKAMSGVEGVRSVDVDFDTKTATVVYDPTVATAEAIAAASAGAGYPATAI
ncbi:MAG: heavy-metal-associated domain-containing protein [Parvularculaceae bacterium]